MNNATIPLFHIKDRLTLKEQGTFTMHALRTEQKELYDNIHEGARLSKFYVTTLFLSIIVAIVGLHENNVAVIIGAMVIAPMFGPSMAMGLGAALGDLLLMRHALGTAFVGISVTILLSYCVGLFLYVDPTATELALRTQVGWGDVTAGLASGCAGAVAYTTGKKTTLIGVMLAVSLVPPLVTFGLLLGGGLHFSFAKNALLLFVVNVLCMNLASMLTFAIQGVHPYNWLQKKDAMHAAQIAIGMAVILLTTIISLVFII